MNSYEEFLEASNKNRRTGRTTKIAEEAIKVYKEEGIIEVLPWDSGGLKLVNVFVGMLMPTPKSFRDHFPGQNAMLNLIEIIHRGIGNTGQVCKSSKGVIIYDTTRFKLGGRGRGSDLKAIDNEKNRRFYKNAW